MGRKFIECNEEMSPGGSKCHEMITADTEKELLELAGRHAINIHGAANTEGLRDNLRGMIKERTL
jgi:predicted small metal-binding protein